MLCNWSEKIMQDDNTMNEVDSTYKIDADNSGFILRGGV
jgi:hypothetical protein